MRDTSVAVRDLQIVVHAGRETSSRFVVDLTRPIFGSSEIEFRSFGR